MGALKVQCDHCEYWDAGYDHDLIMIELRLHEAECLDEGDNHENMHN